MIVALADGRTGEDRRKGTMDEQRHEVSATASPHPPRPRSPLIIGAISCGLMVWMFVVIMLLIAWKLFA
jgi:hypothetical protein